MKTLGLILLIALWATGLTYATPVYGTSALGESSGMRAEGSGIVVGGSYATDDVVSTIEWNINGISGGLWSYIYTLVGFSSPAISHFILDLTDDCVPANPGCVIEPNGATAFATFGSAPSNPGFPVGASIVGLKFDFGGESPVIYSFTSNRGPVYGDFYSKGGADSFVYNAGLPNRNSASITDFVARPDGAIPEPASVSLIALGLVLGVTVRLGHLSRRRPRPFSQGRPKA